MDDCHSHALSTTGRRRHLIFLAHVWATAPFALLWLLMPSMRIGESRSVIAGQWALAALTAVYLIGRTWLAWLDRPRVPWNYLYPIPDAVLISLSLYMSRSSESVLYYTYALPIIAAASTLNVAWAATVGVVSVLGALTATLGFEPISYLGAAYRLVSLIVLASLTTWLARLGADVQARLSVADERNRIAMEMHDGVQAHLIVIASQMELAARTAAHDPARTEAIAADCRDLARQAADDLRFLVHRLRSIEPAEAFIPALRQYLHNLSARTGLAIGLEVIGDPHPIGSPREHALFRITQESLNNTLKHAEADEVSVTVGFHEDSVRLTVSDNGRGFDPERSHAEAGHQGIEGMRQTARSVGGEVSIESSLGEGTTITAVVPRPERDSKTWLRLLRH